MSICAADPKIWAKMGDGSDRYPLIAHLLDTAASALVLWDAWLREGLRELIAEALGCDLNTARRLVAYAAGLHDVGKANAVFQTQMLAARRGDWVKTVKAELSGAGYPNLSVEDGWEGYAPHKLAGRHEAVGYHALTDWKAQEIHASPLSKWVAVAALGHHGRFLDTTSEFGHVLEDIRETSIGAWGQQQDAHIDTVARGLEVRRVPDFVGEAGAAALILVCGLVQLADHLASAPEVVTSGRSHPRLQDAGADPADWIARRYELFMERLPATLGVYRAPSDPVRAVRGTSKLTDLQAHALTVGGGLWIATAVTGDGKTDAAGLRHMTRTDEGLIFALPTRATTDAIMDRVLPWFKGTGMLGGVAHGTAALHAFYAPVDQGEGHGDRGLHAGQWYERGDRALLNPVLVATCDQVLRGALSQRGAPMRLLALANKHVVLDEVHTYDLYQSELLVELLAWWGATRTRVTLITATLETWQRNLFSAAYHDQAPQLQPEEVRFPDHMLIDPTSGAATFPKEPPAPRLAGYQLKLDVVRTAHPDVEHVSWAKAMRTAHPDARIGIVVNTVDRAIRIAEQLDQAGHDVILLHSRMVAGHRSAVTDRLLRDLGPIDEDDPTLGQGKAVTVVGTQVVEASLDIDLDLLSTDLAPAPSLVQRAGRAWRFADTRRVDRIGDLAGEDQRAVRIVAHVTSDGDLDPRQAPYLTFHQRRTLEACESTPVLESPGGVQPFVEAAAVSLDEALELSTSAGATDEDRAVLSALQRREQAASRASAPLSGPQGYLADPTLGHLIDLTARAATRSEMATRFVELDSDTFVLIDPTGTHPWAMHITVEELAGLTGRDGLIAALRASVPVHSALRAVLYKAHRQTVPGVWAPKANLLAEYLPVDISAVRRVEYGDLGLRFSTGVNV